MTSLTRWILPLMIGALLAACGSGGSPDTGTVRSERDARDASIMQQERLHLAPAAGVIDFGHREGLPFTRNVLGDPDAPVLIVEYSDFQ